MSASEPLAAALAPLLDELDRLMLVGQAGRNRRGAGLVSVETLRYARLDVARVLGDEAPAESLRGLTRKLDEGGLGAASPLRALAAQLEGLL